MQLNSSNVYSNYMFLINTKSMYEKYDNHTFVYRVFKNNILNNRLITTPNRQTTVISWNGSGKLAADIRVESSVNNQLLSL